MCFLPEKCKLENARPRILEREQKWVSDDAFLSTDFVYVLAASFPPFSTEGSATITSALAI